MNTCQIIIKNPTQENTLIIIRFLIYIMMSNTKIVRYFKQITLIFFKYNPFSRFFNQKLQDIRQLPNRILSVLKRPRLLVAHPER